MKKRFYSVAVSVIMAAALLLSSCSFLVGDTAESDRASSDLSSPISSDVGDVSSGAVTEDPSSDTSSDTSSDISSSPESDPNSSENASSSPDQSDASSVTSPDISSAVSSDISSETSSDISSAPSQPSSELSSESQPSSNTSGNTSSGGSGDVQDIFTPITLSQYYYRSTLNSAERQLYDAVVNASDSYSATVVLPAPADKATVDKVLKYFFLDHPENFWWGRTYTLYGSSDRVTRLTMKPLFSESEILQMQNEIDSAVEEIFKQIPKKATDFDIEEIFHDHLVNTMTYTLPENDPQGETMSYTLYGALVEKKGVCEAYSEAFQYLCNLAGIPCFGITGTANGGGHKWNGVEIDGRWYITDATWDDPTGSAYAKHSYFNVTSALISDSHVPDSYISSVLPKFTATESSFYAYHGLVCDLESLDGTLKAAIAFFGGGVSHGAKFAVEISCPDSDTADDCFSALSANNFRRLRELVSDYNRENGTNYSFASYYDPDMCILRFVLQAN